jgi:hypothetical protein
MKWFAQSPLIYKLKSKEIDGQQNLAVDTSQPSPLNYVG